MQIWSCYCLNLSDDQRIKVQAPQNGGPPWAKSCLLLNDLTACNSRSILDSIIASSLWVHWSSWPSWTTFHYFTRLFQDSTHELPPLWKPFPALPHTQPLREKWLLSFIAPHYTLQLSHSYSLQLCVYTSIFQTNPYAPQQHIWCLTSLCIINIQTQNRL